MSKILAKLRQRAPPPAPDIDDQTILHQHSRHSTLESEQGSITLGVSPARTTIQGSHFVEEFADGFGEQPSPRPSTLLHTPISRPSALLGTITPSPSGKSLGLDIPESAAKSLHIGTPKLVLTDPGSNSPRSFSSSPSKDSPARRPEGFGLGLGTQAQELYTSPSSSSLDNPSPRKDSYPSNPRRNSKSNLSIISNQDTSGNLSPSLPGDIGQEGETRKRRGSIISRLKGGGSSPKLSPTLLDVKPDKSSRHGMNKDKRSRRLSASSGKAKSIAAAIVGKSGHNVTGSGHPSTPDEQNKRHSFRNSHAASLGDGLYGDDDYDDDDDFSGSELDDDLPVSGFAVASNRRNADFHALFPTVDDGDYLIEDYGCALSKDILVQGRLYVSENHICFHANIFGWVTDVVIPFQDIRVVEKKMTALVIPNAIGISTGRDKYTFASFLSRDTTFDVMMNIWRLCNPNAVMSSLSLGNTSRPPSITASDPGDSPTDETTRALTGRVAVSDGMGGGNKGHAVTRCDCGKEGRHYSETAIDVTLPSTPEKIYNLMFSSDWVKTFLVEDQKLRELEMSDWKPIEGKKLLTRSLSYIRPLNGSIGPKQTKCHIVDEQEHYDLDTYICMITTTRTPDVPSGGVFSVKTRTCLTWAGSNSTKMLVTTVVEWTGKSWIKGIIEKSAIDGQKQYHDQITKSMRSYIKQHPTEFGSLEGEVDEASPTTGLIRSANNTTDAERQTEAELYAAKNRQKRQDADLGYIQGGVDKVVSGVGAIGTGIGIVFESIGDLMSDLPIGKDVIIGSFILLLLLSNIYTYFAYHTQAPHQQARRQVRENDLSEVVRMLLSKQGDSVVPGQNYNLYEEGHRYNHRFKDDTDLRGEAIDLMKLLDDVEIRTQSLRREIRQAGRQTGPEEIE